MSKAFYLRLAAGNLRKNAKTILPFAVTSICAIAMFYILYALSLNKGIAQLPGAGTMAFILTTGSVVIALFSIIFLFYTNSFLIKRRKKEFGLFNILGMEKRHLAKVMLYETLMIAAASLLLGLGTGVALNRLMYLALLKLLRFPVPMAYELTPNGLIVSALLFGGIFLLTLLNNLRQIQLAKPVELLKGGAVGEKEPKAKGLLVLLGLASLGAGYYLAVAISNPAAAIMLFFPATLLVILGTYCLFTAGSIALLKLLKRNKGYYYKAKHFIAVSGMLYRMKQNAVGLANICILSTAVLIMLSSTVSLYAGTEDAFQSRYPQDVMITLYQPTPEAFERLQGEVDQLLVDRGLEAKDVQYRTSFGTLCTAEQRGGLILSETGNTDLYALNATFLEVIPLADYNRLTGRTVALAPDEALIYKNRGGQKEVTVTVFGQAYRIKENLDQLPFGGESGELVMDTYYMVVPDLSQVNLPAQSRGLLSKLNFNLDTDEVKREDLRQAIGENLKALEMNVLIEPRSGMREEFYGLYGGLLFIGLFLGLLFILATVLIIYYKQLSEGYDDQGRFLTMQKVGMGLREVKQAIRSQVLTVFFMPLAAAGIHVAVAFKLVQRVLLVLNLTNTALFEWCLLGVLGVFALFYALVYSLTARVYYRIVSNGETR